MKNNNKQTNKRHADPKRNKVAALQATLLMTITLECYRSKLNSGWFSIIFIHLLSLIIHELALGDKGNSELTYSVGQKILTWI